MARSTVRVSFCRASNTRKTSTPFSAAPRRSGRRRRHRSASSRAGSGREAASAAGCWEKSAPEGPKPFPGILFEEAQACVEGGATPSTRHSSTRRCRCPLSTDHVFHSHPRRHQALVSVPKGELCDTDLSQRIHGPSLSQIRSVARLPCPRLGSPRRVFLLRFAASSTTRLASKCSIASIRSRTTPAQNLADLGSAGAPPRITIPARHPSPSNAPGNVGAHPPRSPRWRPPRAADRGDDLSPVSPAADTDDDAVLDPRAGPSQHVLDLRRVDIEAARDDQLLHPIDDPDEAVGRPRRRVAGAHQPPASSTAAAPGAIPVSAEDLRSVDQQLPGYPDRKVGRRVVRVDDPDRVEGKGRRRSRAVASGTAGCRRGRVRSRSSRTPRRASLPVTASQVSTTAGGSAMAPEMV